MFPASDRSDVHVLRETAAASESVISVKKFLASWDKDIRELSRYSSERESNSYIARNMGVPDDLVEELSEVCGVETLLCGEEPSDKNNLLRMKGLPKHIDLTCVKYQERELERRKQVDYKLFAMQKMKYRVMDVMKLPPDSSVEVPTERKVQLPNVVLTVKILRPKVNSSIVGKGETFLVLGTQKLTELRDHITCMKDDAIAGDLSDYPTIGKEVLEPAKNIYKSALFFIENTFYNDMREPDNRDYSLPILQWATEVKHGSGNFSTAKMEETTFSDLEIQFGVPYLYQHQGNCEHLLVFTDLRLLHPEDPQDITMYPFLVSETINKRTICRACQMESARWMVVESPLTPESPCFMCNVCFMALHYVNGQRVCHFEAYKYREKLADL